MKLHLIDDWYKIRKHFGISFKTSFHVSIASSGADGFPNATPIGSFFLNDDQTGFYFEKYPTKLPQALQVNNKVCILGVNSSRWFWFKSLLNSRFDKYSAIKLYGEAGVRRKVTKEERRALKRRMRFSNQLKGHKYLWGEMDYVRDIKITKVESIKLGKMTE